LAAAVIIAAARPFSADGPPPAHTGGFGEPTCRACHHTDPLNAPGGALTIDSLPLEGFTPGRTYQLTVRLSRPGMAIGGFQLSVREDRSNGRDRPAGSLAPVDDHTQLVRLAGSAVPYLQHTRRGTALPQPDTARWVFRWQAPGAQVPVVFHLVANAANGDNSELDDAIYATVFHLVATP
jgi:hypothetical protein